MPEELPAPRAAAPAAASDALGAALPTGPVPSGAPAPDPAQVYEGADALAALKRDLAGGGLLSLQEVSTPAAADAVDTAVVTGAAPGADIPVEAAESPPERVSWRNDEIKGRRLGDRPAAVPAENGGENGVETWLFGADGFGFDDLLDVINPLQHIPIVSSIYRWITGDEMEPAATVAGGTLFGGPIGLLGSLASVAFEEATGDDLGGHAIAAIFGDDATPADADNLAAVPATAPQVAAAPAAGAPLHEASRVFSGGIPTSPLPALGRPVAFIPANAPAMSEPGETPTEPGGPAGGAALAPADAAIAAQMMDALNKYQALVQARVGTAPSMEPAAGSIVDSRF